MLKKIKNLIRENRQLHKENLLQLKELEWAHIYHDSIRGKDWLEKLPLNIGRWAGNYPFFYLLNRILTDFKPNSILEFGLGESSKFVSTYLENELKNSNHLIIEQDETWHQNFKLKFQLSLLSKVAICPLYKRKVFNCDVNSYSGIEDIINQNFDLYIVDGPFGSENYSRYDIVELARDFTKNDEFIIIIDDYQRIGEKETVQELLKMLKEKGITIYWGEYSGNKSVGVLGTEKYKSVKSF
ncbi:hypothetical protein Lupro_02340 [Lutibacter profundi]|uniref:Methyltransferase n=1 Tax=Lutibacter profundi TaxID=1622118 RepID=A0A0X8G506_9FLAO|nr:hypothetical protein [Lutibacter profundi]AMC10158.1 hypothetical protein Lupro_02340 [Lutibacter profundi]